MGIHYDYKSVRGEKAMKKEAKKKARIEQRRAKKTNKDPKALEEKDAATLEDCSQKIIIILKEIKTFEIKCFLSVEYDHLDI